MVHICPSCNQPVRTVTELDNEHRTYRYRDAVISLTIFELTLLKLLMQRPGEVYTYREIFKHVWGDDQPATAKASLRVLVYKLNQKLSGHGLTIRNQSKAGYYATVSAS